MGGRLSLPRKGMNMRVSSEKGPHGPLIALIWTLAVCAVSQIPFRYIWVGETTFPYDAFTTFNPWFIGGLNDLRNGRSAFGIYKPEMPFDIWPSYLYSGLLRQVFAPFQSNTAIGHAMVQALHGVLYIPAMALLLRTFGVRWWIGCVAGAIFALSGINISVSQHVIAYEAILYLLLVLFSSRYLITNWRELSVFGKTSFVCLLLVMAVSLARDLHEAILYFLPILGWLIGHLVLFHKKHGRLDVSLLMALFFCGAGILIASIPMLIATYELSKINKTTIASYSELAPYFKDVSVFVSGLLVPGFTGATAPSLPLRFDFSQEPTLSYLFCGILTMPLSVVAVSKLVREKRVWHLVTLAFVLVILFGYTTGPGNPIHRGLCIVFPFLVQIAHQYYGLHLIFVVLALLLGIGLEELAEGRGWITLQFSIVGGFAALLLIYCHFTVLPSDAGFQGNAAAFHGKLVSDMKIEGVVLAIALSIAALGKPKAKAVPGHAIGRAIAPLFLLGALALGDMIRPTLYAQFTPTTGWMSWAQSPMGGFTPSKKIREYLKNSGQVPAHASMLPLFPREGGWQANALLVEDMHLLRLPSDTAGNRFFEQALQDAKDVPKLVELTNAYCVNYIWVPRWGADNAQALTTAAGFEKVYPGGNGGDLYSTALWKKPYCATPFRRSDKLAQSLWTIEYENSLHLSGSLGGYRVLPLMWHKFYEASIDGRPVDYSRDVLGRLVISEKDWQRDEKLELRYPASSLVVAQIAGLFVYFLSLMLAIFLPIYERWRNRHVE